MMDDSVEFSISEETLQKIISLRDKMGFSSGDWDKLFDYLIENFAKNEIERPKIERVFEENHYKKNYQNWVQYFSLNLNNIWQEFSARELDPTSNPSYKPEDHSAIVIGAGPSIKKKKHLELLANSNYNGAIICTDRSLIPALKDGITPERFPNFNVLTIDPAEILKKFYNDEIVSKFGNKINGIFATVIHPSTVDMARKAGVKIHWLHSLFDYSEGKKSFNQISALMVRAKTHLNGLPAIQTGGNVGTASWFVAWQILKCSTVCLIGINHGWDEDDSWDEILAHANAPSNIDRTSSQFQKLYPKIYNPEFDCYCIQDPVYQYYSNAFKEFVARAPSWVNTINATEGGCIFGERISCMTFNEFLNTYKR
jgi:hypothetical protein